MKVFSPLLKQGQVIMISTRKRISLILISLLVTSSIQYTIKEISPTSAPGPDGITPKFLKAYAEELAEPLYLLWRKSLDIGDNLDGTHLAYITAIFKSGDKSEAANY